MRFCGVKETVRAGKQNNKLKTNAQYPGLVAGL